MIVLTLIQNFALLIALASSYRVFTARVNEDTIQYHLLLGLLFGGIGVVAMMTPLNLAPGIIYDGRSIVLSLAGLFGGPLAALVAASMVAAYQLYLGGTGAWVGFAVVVESAALGVLFYFLRRSAIIRVRWLELWGLGILVHVLVLVVQLALPGGRGPAIVQQVGLPILLLYPLVTVLVGLLFLDTEKQLRDRLSLQESEKALNKAQRVAHLGSWVWHIASNRLEWSEEMYRIFGIDRAKFSGSLPDVIAGAIHPDDRAAVEASNQSVVEQGKPIPLEYRIIRPDGTVRVVWAEAGELLRDSSGMPALLTGIVQDITEQRAAERALRESELRYRNLIVGSPDAIFVNHHDQVVLANNACVKLFGAQKEEDLLGKPVVDLFPPDFHPQVLARIRTLREKGSPVPLVEERIMRLDGRQVDVDVIASPFTFQGENDIHVILRDISERKQMEEELRQSHDLLSRLAEQVPGAIFQMRYFPHVEACFPYASPGLQEMLEVSPEAVREDASPIFERVHPQDRQCLLDALHQSVRTGWLLREEFRVVLPRQGECWRLCSAKANPLPQGGTLWYGIITDITDRKRAEQKISEQLEELNRWHNLMIGREERVIELKKEVNELLQQAGQPARYEAGREPAQ